MPNTHPGCLTCENAMISEKGEPVIDELRNGAAREDPYPSVPAKPATAAVRVRSTSSATSGQRWSAASL